MNNVDSGIKSLSLRVKKEAITWSVFKAGMQGDTRQELSSGEERFDLSPLNRDTINFLIEQQRLLADVKYISQVRWDVDAASRKNIRLLGGHLYRVLFIGPIHTKLVEILNEVDLKLLRIELEFEDEELASWPWEYAYRPMDTMSGSGAFLAETAQLVLNRVLPISKLPLAVKANTYRPRILLVVSMHRDFPQIGYLTVLEALRELNIMQVVELTTLIEEFELSPEYQPRVTRKDFRATLRKFSPHIIHFIGYGRFTFEGGHIAMAGGEGQVDWVRDGEFAKMAATAQDLKCIFLQICEGALLDPYSTVSSMALQLAHRNIPAVVAMQYKIESEIANTFACGFYQALANGLPVDLAVKAGREAINDEFPDELQYHAFGLPVLYLRSYESIIVQEKAPSKVAIPRLLENVNTYTECPRCQTPAPPTRFCSHCGLRFVCQYCDTRLENPLGMFCDACGKPISA
jgi:hypothetical protein